MKNNPLATVCISFCLGIWTARLVHIPLLLVFISCILFLVAALTSLEKKLLFSLSLGLAIFLAGFIHLTNTQTYPANHILNFVSDKSEKVYVMGKVVSGPEVSRTFYHSQKTNFNFSVIARRSDITSIPTKQSKRKEMASVAALPRNNNRQGIASSFDKSSGRSPEQSRRASSPAANQGAPRNDYGQWQLVEGLIKVTCYGERKIQYADRLLLQGLLERPPELRNPGGFDYQAYLANHNIFGLLNVKEKDAFLSLRGGISSSSLRGGISSSSLRANEVSEAISKEGIASSVASLLPRNDGLLRRIFQFKQKLHNIICQHLKPEQASLLSAILLGERANLSQEIKDLFIKTGTIHILAISGLHVGLITLILIALFRFLRLGRKLTFILTIFFLICYALLSGMRPSVLRATIMAVIVLCGFLINREVKLYNSLGLAALVILIFNPRNLFDSGFQLSFLSVISIVYFTPSIEKFFSVRSRFFRYLIRAFSVSLAAWLGIAPIGAYYFNIVAPVAILANLLIIPCLFLVVIVGICFLFFAYLWTPLGAIFGETCWLALFGLTKLTALIAKVPLGFFHCPKPGILFFCGYYALILLMFNYKRLRISSARLWIILALVANFLAWKPLFRGPSDRLTVTFLDVGHGDAIFVELPYSAGTMLIDGGSALESDAGRWVILPFLWNKGINQIDAVLLSHPDDDHVGGLASVLKNMKVNYAFDNGMSKESISYISYKAEVQDKVPYYRVIKQGEQIFGFPRAELFVIHPPGLLLSGTEADTNNNSIVLKLVYKDVSFLFCGDIQEEAIGKLLLYQPILKSTIIKVPHHGSYGGKIVDYLFQAVSPKFAVISVGRDSRFGFPAREVVEGLEKIGAQVYNTGDHGAVIISTDGQDVRVETMIGAEAGI